MTGVAIGKLAEIEERSGHRHFPSLFWLVIASSGERKSPVFKHMAAPLESWSIRQEAAFAEAMAGFRAKTTAIDTAISGLKSAGRKMSDLSLLEEQLAELERQRPEPPVKPMLFSADVTEERLFQKLHERGGEFAVLSAEARPILDNIMGRYSSGGRTGDAIYLAATSGDTITRDRVGSEGRAEERVVWRPVLTVCGMCQADKYIELASHPALRASGALARIWPAWLLSLVGERLEDVGEVGLQDELMGPFRRLLTTLLRFREQGSPRLEQPHLASLSAEAAELRRLLHNQIEARMGAGGDLVDVRDIASKAVSNICKLALILHLADAPELLEQETSVIDEDCWRRAESIGSWHLAEAVRAQRVAGENPLLDGARRTLDWLRRERMVTVKGIDLQQYGPRPRPSGREAGEILELLADHGYLLEDPALSKRKPVYRVNPHVHDA
ncbi:DUF3987 domain-containing protein [Magnetovirga frankeli]|nr:DUF3987 domain-containing protein [gamma proteobacterium SS-5]